MAKYRGILFDLGGTLFEHQDAASARANLQHFAARVGIGMDSEQLAVAYTRVRAEVEIEFSRRGFYLHRELVAASAARLAASAGVAAPADAVTEYCDLQRAAVTIRLQPRADCVSTLDRLRQQGCYLSIVSNIDNDYLDPLLERTGLAAFFDDCLSSESAGSCKPDPVFFEEAIARSGHPVDALLYVGDSLIHDVAGANAIQLDVALLTAAGGVTDAEIRRSRPAEVPTYRISQLTDLLTLR